MPCWPSALTSGAPPTGSVLRACEKIAQSSQLSESCSAESIGYNSPFGRNAIYSQTLRACERISSGLQGVYVKAVHGRQSREIPPSPPFDKGGLGGFARTETSHPTVREPAVRAWRIFSQALRTSSSSPATAAGSSGTGPTSRGRPPGPSTGSSSASPRRGSSSWTRDRFSGWRPGSLRISNTPRASSSPERRAAVWMGWKCTGALGCAGKEWAGVREGVGP